MVVLAFAIGGAAEVEDPCHCHIHHLAAAKALDRDLAILDDFAIWPYKYQRLATNLRWNFTPDALVLGHPLHGSLRAL